VRGHDQIHTLIHYYDPGHPIASPDLVKDKGGGRKRKKRRMREEEGGEGGTGVTGGDRGERNA